MDARPRADRLPLEPAGRDLARGLAAVAGRGPGRRLRPDLDHPVRHGRPGRALRLRLPAVDLVAAGGRPRGGDRPLRLRLLAPVARPGDAPGSHRAGGAAGRAAGGQVRCRQVPGDRRPLPAPDRPAHGLRAAAGHRHLARGRHRRAGQRLLPSRRLDLQGGGPRPSARPDPAGRHGR
jgi:hypothetical protein